MIRIGFFISILFSCAEIVLAYSAKGANKILGKILKLCAGSNTVIGIAYCLVIFPSAYVTYIFHNKHSFKILL